LIGRGYFRVGHIKSWSDSQLTHYPHRFGAPAIHATMPACPCRTVRRCVGRVSATYRSFTPRGEPSSTDTRRALARAFDADDIDCFNKPQMPWSEEQMQAHREKLERETVTLAVWQATGKKLAELGESAEADFFYAAAELPREATEVFAALTDCWREYRDANDLYSEVDKLDVYDDFESRLDELKAMNFSLRLGERVVAVKASGDNASALKINVAYVVAFS